jgi:hypothetical protein
MKGEIKAHRHLFWMAWLIIDYSNIQMRRKFVILGRAGYYGAAGTTQIRALHTRRALQATGGYYGFKEAITG